MVWVYCYYTYFNSSLRGPSLSRQNLTSTDVRFWRIKTVTALKGLMQTIPVSQSYVTDWQRGALLSQWRANVCDAGPAMGQLCANLPFAIRYYHLLVTLRFSRLSDNSDVWRRVLFDYNKAFDRAALKEVLVSLQSLIPGDLALSAQFVIGKEF